MAEITVDKKIIVVPDPGSPCDAWKVYFDKLKQMVGKDNAKTIWLATWKFNGALSCTTNDDFNQFLKKNQIDVSIAATRAIADVSAIGGNILGLGKSLSKMLAIGVPVLLGSVLLVVIVLLAKAAKNVDVVDLALLATGSKGAVAAKHLSK